MHYPNFEILILETRYSNQVCESRLLKQRSDVIKWDVQTCEYVALLKASTLKFDT